VAETVEMSGGVGRRGGAVWRGDYGGCSGLDLLVDGAATGWVGGEAAGEGATVGAAKSFRHAA